MLFSLKMVLFKYAIHIVLLFLSDIKCVQGELFSFPDIFFRIATLLASFVRVLCLFDSCGLCHTEKVPCR